MKSTLIKLLILLYPHAWRQRYGAEYRALLEDMPLTWRMGFDSLRGALDAHLHPEWINFRRWPMNQKRSFRIAAGSALLSALVLSLSVLNISRLADAEFLLLLAPVTLLPLVLVLHKLYRPVAPGISWVTAVIGIISMGTFLFGTLIGMSAEAMSITLPLPVWFRLIFQIFTALIGVWIILAAYLGWHTHLLPNGLPSMMITSALGWSVVCFVLIFISPDLGAPARSFSAIMGAGFAIWLMTHFVWTIWLGVWLWQQSNNYDLGKPLTSS